MPRESEGSEAKQRKDGRWEVVVYVDGVRRSVYGRTPRDAKSKVRKLLNQRDTGVWAEGTLGEYVADFLDAMPGDPRYAPTSCERYDWDMSLVPRWLMEKPIGKVRTSDVQRALNEVLTTPTKRFKPRAPSTVNKVRDTLRRIMQQACADDLILKNPVAFTRPVEDDAEPPDPLTGEEWVALKAVLEPHRLWSLFLVTAVIGLRESEVIGLRWSDWDAEARTLRVFEQEARTISGKRHRKEAKSGSKRTVVLPEFVAAVLREYQRGQMKLRLKVGRAWEDNDLIWPSQVGTALGHRNLLRLLHEACRKAGIRRISFHTLRHSAGTVMLEAGLPERTIMDILGHRSLHVTRRYQRVREGLKRQAADELDRHWEGLA